jgi:peptidoglycan/xylan/chitin deacetylase (PgdA/CDA1 family)
LLCLSFCILPVRGAEEKYVVLTFDDGPSGRHTARLLEGLEERNVKATFLLCGYRMAEFPELTQRIFNDGHEIGLHGYSHGDMTEMSRRIIAAELFDCTQLLPEDCDPVFLRPPGGCCSDGVRQVAQAKGLGILDWSVDPEDWANKDTSAIRRSVQRDIRDGDVVLLHDMSDSSVDAALAIVDALRGKGFRFVTVSELARIRDTDIKPGRVYRKFPPE